MDGRNNKSGKKVVSTGRIKGNRVRRRKTIDENGPYSLEVVVHLSICWTDH